MRWLRKNLGPPGVALAEQRVDMIPYLRLAEITGEWVEAFATCLVREGYEANRAGPVDARVLQVYRQLSTHPLHEPPAMSELAARSGLGRKHLERLFCAYAGTSMRSYFDRRRLSRRSGCSRTHGSRSRKSDFNSASGRCRIFRRGFDGKPAATRWRFARDHRPGRRAAMSKLDNSSFRPGIGAA